MIYHALLKSIIGYHYFFNFYFLKRKIIYVVGKGGKNRKIKLTRHKETEFSDPLHIKIRKYWMEKKKACSIGPHLGKNRMGLRLTRIS